MEGQRITEGGHRRISEGNLIRITEEYIRVWELAPNSVSLGVTPTDSDVSFDIAILSATANLITSGTSPAVTVDIDLEIVSATIALAVSPTDPTIVVDVDVEIISIPPDLLLASSDSSVIVEIDVEIISTSSTLGITPSTTAIRFGPIVVTEGYIIEIPVLDRSIEVGSLNGYIIKVMKLDRTIDMKVLNRAVAIEKTDRNIDYYTKRKSL